MERIPGDSGMKGNALFMKIKYGVLGMAKGSEYRPFL